MSKVTNPQTLNDILQVIEKAQLRGKTIDVDDQGRVKRASFWRTLTGGERSVQIDHAAVHVTNRVTAASLRNAIEAAVSVSAVDRESGENNPYLRLNRAIHQLHASTGSNELPVQAYRQLLQEFGSLPPLQPRQTVDLASVKASDFVDPQNPSLHDPDLQSLELAPAYGAVEGETVKAALLSIGPEGQAIAHRLADFEHLSTSRLVAPEPADRDPAVMVMTQQLLGAREALSESIRDAQAEGDAALEVVLTETWQAIDAQFEQVQQPLPALPQDAQTTWSASLQASPPPSTEANAASAVSTSSELEESQEFFDAVESLEPAPVKPWGTAVGDASGTPWDQHLQFVRDISIPDLQGILEGYRQELRSIEYDVGDLDETTQDRYDAALQRLMAKVGNMLLEMQNDFESFVSQEIEDLVCKLPDSPDRANQAQAIRAAGQDLVAQHQARFDVDKISTDKSVSKTVQFMKEAEFQVLFNLATVQNNTRAALVALRDQYLATPAPNTAVKVQVFRDSTTQKEKISLVQAAPALRNMVLAGGGMKAVGISAALVTYSQAGQLDKVQNIVGNSAGSLTGMVLACGFEMDGLSEFNAMVTNKDLVTGPEIDPPSPFSQRYPGMKFETRGVLDKAVKPLHVFDTKFQTDAPRLMVALDQKTSWSVSKFLNSPECEQLMRETRQKIEQGTSDITEKELIKIMRLSHPDFSGSDREPQMVTFSDLDILHRLDPAHFKTLSIVGFRGDESRMETFSAGLTPDMPIVYAGRISMAAPVVFTAPIYQGVVYRDGGLGNNFPTDVVHQGKSGAALDQSHAETMLFAYEAFDEAQRNLFQHNDKKTSAPIPPGWTAWATYMAEWLAKRQAGAMQFREFNLADSNRVWNSGPQTTVVYHGDIDFDNFGAEEFRKDFAVAQSKMMATEQVALRANLAYNTVFEDPGKAAKAIPPEERQEVLDSLTDDSAMTAQLRLELTRLLNQTQPA